MRFQCLCFNELRAMQVYQIMRLRSEVFVVEQRCIYQDMDDKDIHDEVQHLLLLDNDELLGYARLLPAKLSYATPSIGRVAVTMNARHKNLGAQLVQESITRIAKLWPSAVVTIGAQSHLSTWYKRFGFSEISEHYLEDGILHVDMQIAAN